MPLPGSVKTVPVHVRVVGQDGAIAVGKVRLEGPVALRDATSKTVVGAPRYSGTLDTNGEITFPSVIANDASNVSPSGWSYTLVVETDIWRDRIQIQVPSATVGTLEIAQTAVSNPGVASVTYVLSSTRGVAGGVATLDNAAQIPLNQLGNAPAGSGTPYTVLAFSQGGVIAVAPGAGTIYNDSGRTLTIRSVRASVGTAPTGAALIVDVKKSGTTIFTTQANRPTIPAGSKTSGKVINMDVVTIADGEYFTVDVAQVGATVAGSDLVVQIWAA